jgi:hypothetical protein
MVVATDLKNIITTICYKVFKFHFDEYLTNSGRVLYQIRLIEDKHSKIVDCCQLSGPNNPELIDAIKRKGLPNCKSGYLVDAGPDIGMPDLKADLFFVSDTLLKEDHRIIYGQIFHELCHLVIGANLTRKFPLDSNSYQQGREIRKYTQYAGPYGKDSWHTDDWFALLFIESSRLASEYPCLYRSHQDAAKCSLLYDIFLDEDSLKTVQWL